MTLVRNTDVDLPPKLEHLLEPKRYKVLRGGRGAAKSWSIARALAALASQKKLLVICVRETQASITESVHRLLSDQIKALDLADDFDIGKAVIRCISTGSEFIFAGIRTDPAKIKSLEGADVCWVSEAAKISENSWRTLIPTIRKEGSEIWIDFNPDEESDPTSKRFIANPPPDSTVVEMNWQDNPWFPETLRKEKDYDYRVDPEAAAHVWGGQFRKASQAQIFKGKYIVQDFEAEQKNKAGELEPKIGWTGPYFGADWGFSNDPTVLLKMWLFERKLWIEHEAYGIGVNLNEIPQLFDSIPGSRKYVIRGDCSRPETIFHVSSLGFNVVAADKWQGSVEDGITWLRGLEQIVIHSRCKHTEEEARLYRFKVDPVTGDVLPIILDKHNHCWDSTRYALSPAIKVAEEDLTMVYEEPETSFNPEMDEFELRNGL